MNIERSRKRWTKEEREYLCENWGKLKVSSIAKTLKRSHRAVQSQATSLKLGSQMKWYSSMDIAYMLGLSLCSVIRYMDSNKLEHIRDKTKNKRRMSSENQIKRFMKNYQDLWDSRKVNINLIDIKKQWYLDKVESDKKKSIKRNSRYTDMEIKILIDRCRRGWDLDQISIELNRSKKSIYSKLISLDFGRGLNF